MLVELATEIRGLALSVWASLVVGERKKKSRPTIQNVYIQRVTCVDL